jgi:DnaJ-class molecular chaperone
MRETMPYNNGDYRVNYKAGKSSYKTIKTNICPECKGKKYMITYNENDIWMLNGIEVICETCVGTGIVKPYKKREKQ